jgi:biopolymer transport protein ExbB
VRLQTAFVLGALQFAGAATPSFAQEAAPSSSASSADEEKSAEIDLREAYQKEFAFLASQKRELTQRLDAVSERHDQEYKDQQQEIAALESRLLRLEGQAQTLREKVDEARSKAQTRSDDTQLIGVTLDQASTTLEDYGIEIPSPSEEQSEERLLEKAFAEALAILNRFSTVRSGKDSFFLKDGTKVDGTILRVGQIAAYGASPKGAGALAPAGGGDLKIWRESGESTARALIEGNSPEFLDIFLFESLDKAVDEELEGGIYAHVSDGGAIAWVIVSLGAIGLLLAGLRTTMLTLFKSPQGQIESSVVPLVRDGKLLEAADSANRIRGSAARALTSVLRSLDNGSDRIDDAISESLLAESRGIQRFATTILVIAAVSPLLGLLGTVTGMISTFDVITKFGTGDPKMLSGGISTALITTELGLIVAIPTLLLGSLLKGWGEAIEEEAELTVMRVLNIHTESSRSAAPGPDEPA